MHRTSHLSRNALLISLAACAMAIDSSAALAGEEPAAKTLQTRNITYVSGQVAEDDDTWVVGGAEGSSILLIHDRSERIRRTTWVFLHGNHMYLNVPGEQPEIVTNRPGWGVVSAEGDWDERAEPISTRELSRHLEKLFNAHGVLHVPFLAPQDAPSTGTADPGAHESEARRMLRRMRLNMMITGSNTTGRVVEQSPVGGTPVAPGTSVWVRLAISGSAPTPKGDTFGAAITIAAPSAHGSESYTAMITPEHHNSGTAASPLCGHNGTDLFWRIPSATGAPRDFTANIDVPPGPRYTLSAWKLISGSLVPIMVGADQACHEKRKPSIEFNDGGDDVYLVVDVNTRHLERRGPEELTLEVVWP